MSVCENMKHEGQMSCDTCGNKFSSSETLLIHTANTHKSTENVDCGNWMCMEENKSCGGFCTYNLPIPPKNKTKN